MIININHILGDDKDKAFSNVRLFDYDKLIVPSLEIKDKFKLVSVIFDKGSQKIEFIVKNNTLEDINNTNVKITYLKEFFEKEIINENIEFWFAEEELIFITPHFVNITDYLLTIIN